MSANSEKHSDQLPDPSNPETRGTLTLQHLRDWLTRRFVKRPPKETK